MRYYLVPVDFKKSDGTGHYNYYGFLKNNFKYHQIIEAYEQFFENIYKDKWRVFKNLDDAKAFARQHQQENIPNLEQTSLPVFELEDANSYHRTIPDNAQTLDDFNLKYLTRKNLISVEYLGKWNSQMKIYSESKNFSLNRDIVDARMIHSLEANLKEHSSTPHQYQKAQSLIDCLHGLQGEARDNLPTITFQVNDYLVSPKNDDNRAAYIKSTHPFFSKPLLEHGQTLGGINLGIAATFAIIAGIKLLTTSMSISLLGIGIIAGFAVLGIGLYAAGTSFHTSLSKAMYDVGDAFSSPDFGQ